MLKGLKTKGWGFSCEALKMEMRVEDFKKIENQMKCSCNKPQSKNELKQRNSGSGAGSMVFVPQFAMFLGLR